MHEPAQQPLPHAPNGTRCLSCGYDLIGVQLGGFCPECGSVVRQFSGTGGQTQGTAIAALVLGICALVLGCMTYGVIGLPCGILAIVFARKARLAVQDGQAPVSSLGMATAGNICGWIGLAISALMLLLIIGMIGLGFFSATHSFPAGPAPLPTSP
ncbi:MAG: DUF4190 domain-containing protein [Phycisphaerales bacterium]|nr:DUF4190 domain-containing protein [Planctomycetota bacterium]MCH8509841.1 DUF4190 domain-containing protein [Phycisphaerales bacterium]